MTKEEKFEMVKEDWRVYRLQSGDARAYDELTTVEQLRIARQAGDEKEIARLRRKARAEIRRWAKDAAHRAPVGTRE